MTIGLPENVPLPGMEAVLSGSTGSKGDPVRVPQPIPYQGSKRRLAPIILRYLPARPERLVEPFAGSAALSIAAAARGCADAFWINDAHEPLWRLWQENPAPARAPGGALCPALAGATWAGTGLLRRDPQAFQRRARSGRLPLFAGPVRQGRDPLQRPRGIQQHAGQPAPRGASRGDAAASRADRGPAGGSDRCHREGLHIRAGGLHASRPGLHGSAVSGRVRPTGFPLFAAVRPRCVLS